MRTISFKRRKLDLSKQGFEENFLIYCIDNGNYDFTDNLDFPPDRDGVYVFFTAFPNNMNMEKMDIISKCTMLYCGKTKDLRARFDQHEHKDDLKEHNPLYVAVAYCSNEIEITDLENRMLNYFRFEYNDSSKNSGTHVNVVEDVRL